MKFRAIRENHLFVKAYSKGKRAMTPALVVHILPDYAAARLAKAHPMHRVMNRYGLTVSSKLGGAVTRNRVKRILREGLRSLDRDREIKQGFLVVIAAKTPAVSLKSGDIRKQLEIAFEKLDMLKPAHGTQASEKR